MNHDFDRWLGRQASLVQPDKAAFRLLQARLEDRLQERRRSGQNGLRMSAVMAAVVLLVVLMDAGPLVSFNRDLVLMKGRDDVLVSPPGTRPGGFKIQPDTPQEFWETVQEHRAAGMREFDNAWFVELGGRRNWSSAYRHEIDGKRQLITSPAREPASTLDLRTTRIAHRYLLEVLEQIPEGTVRELPAILVRVDGHDVWMQVWEVDTPDGVFRYGATLDLEP